jgi:hypothetical protein
MSLQFFGEDFLRDSQCQATGTERRHREKEARFNRQLFEADRPEQLFACNFSCWFFFFFSARLPPSSLCLLAVLVTTTPEDVKRVSIHLASPGFKKTFYSGSNWREIGIF